MKRGHIPIRSCKACGHKAPAQELIRWVYREGLLHEDAQQRLTGRGAYCCNREQCRERLHKNKKRVKQAFRL